MRRSPSPGRDRVSASVDRLVADIALVYGLPGWKVITCARDVSDELAARTRENPPGFSVTWGGKLESLLGVMVAVNPAYPPGQWRLVRHDRCEIAPGDLIVHDNCTVIDQEPG